MGIVAAIAVVLGLGIVPMLLYALILWWFDRYEREPLSLVAAAFLWGAVPAIIFSIIAQIAFDIPTGMLIEPGLGSELVSSALIAPLTEEPFKALALLLLLLFFRRELDSPLDGIIYGGLVGFGFAATENTFYFLDAYGTGGLGGVLELSLLRAFLFGLNHALFTGCTGLGVALARTSPRWSVKILAPFLGLSTGIAFHAIHNTSTTLAGELCWPLLVGLVADWGGVAALFATIVWTTSREHTWINRYLADEIDVGTIGRRDYAIIGSYWKRTGERLRALARGDLARYCRLGRYYRLATELAFAKRRWAAFGQEYDGGLQIERLRRKLYELRKAM